MKHDFKYISKNDPEVKKAYADLISILNEVQDLVRNDFTFRYDVVGSYKRNMMTYDANSNIGYDFDFNIEVNDDDENYDANEIKDILRSAMNKVVIKYGYKWPEDSTRVLTIKKVNTNMSRIIHSCDFAIVNNYIDNKGRKCQQYIHFNKSANDYCWNKQSKGYYNLPKKVEWIKNNDLRDDLRNLYLQKKNNNEDSHVHSRTIFAQTVHEIYQKNRYKK